MNAPLTPDLAAARARFWTVRPIRLTCDECGDAFDAMPDGKLQPSYCSRYCRNVARYRRWLDRSAA